MAYGDFQDLIRRAIVYKVFCDGYQCGSASMVHKVFDKKTSGGTVKN